MEAQPIRTMQLIKAQMEAMLIILFYHVFLKPSLKRYLKLEPVISPRLRLLRLLFLRVKNRRR